MLCVNPMSVQRPNGNGPKDRVSVPCGRCYACKAKRQEDWALRLMQEFKASKNAYFITLTYDEEHLPWGNESPTLCKRDIQLFIKRLRKVGKVRYFIVGEYGDKTSRPHYHGIIFNLPGVNQEDTTKIIVDKWQNGHVLLGTVNPASIRYTTKYCLKTVENIEEGERGFMLCSSKPGIGYNYISDSVIKYHEAHMANFSMVLPGGIKKPMPRYYRHKIWSEKQRKEQSEAFIKMSDEKINEEIKKSQDEKQNYFYDLVNRFEKNVQLKINKQNQKSKL